jgi:DNA (cytosine-5)-methyltransferase 1
MSTVSDHTSTITPVTNPLPAPATAVDTSDTEQSGGGPLKVAEFFAGIGLAHLGLKKAKFNVVWANDLEVDKQTMYEQHFGPSGRGHEYVLGDIANVQAKEIPRGLSLAWASFPCTDLSLAGGREGLKGKQSGTFWELTRILKELDADRPPLVALENVNGFATSHQGEDLREAVRTLNALGYSVDVVTIDARRFVPQSRPRLFVVGVLPWALEAYAKDSPGALKPELSVLRPKWLIDVLNKDASLMTHQLRLPDPPPLLDSGFSALVEHVAEDDPQWWNAERTAKFMSELSTIQRERLDKLQSEAVEPIFRTAYRRTRDNKPAWEIRADDIAGCLRTARGGSSKQAVVRIQRRAEPRVRWMTPLEYAKLMGAGEYRMPVARRNQALFGFGDAVCVLVVEWLGDKYLHPIAAAAAKQPRA